MTKLIFRSGLRTIGGTIVELIDDKKRIVFDFGCLFDPSSAQEILPNVDFLTGETNFDDLVLISHLHLDHTKAMNLVDDSIDVVMSKESVKLATILQENGFDGFLGKIRNYMGVDYNQMFKFGDFEITFFEVDHDVPGACAIEIINKDLSLLYTGDFRLHGHVESNTRKFLKLIENKIYDCVITEGVMYSFIEDDYKIVASDEVLVYDSDFKKNDINDEFVLFNSYIMNIQRLGYYYDIAKRYNKQLVLTNKNASLFKKYFNEDFLELDVDITFDVLNKQVNKYIIDFDYNNKEDYKDLIGSKTILHMGGEPLGDYDPRYKVYLDFCKTYDFKLLVTGCGGHATVENLKYVLNNINHKFLYPLHSFKPELIKSDNSEQILPSINEEFIFIDHNLEK